MVVRDGVALQGGQFDGLVAFSAGNGRLLRRSFRPFKIACGVVIHRKITTYWPYWEAGNSTDAGRSGTW